MGLFQRKRDPLKKRAQSVQNQLDELNSQIQDLDENPAQTTFELNGLKQNGQSLPRHPNQLKRDQLLDTKSQQPEKLWDRIINNFRKPPVSNNPKIVNFLAEIEFHVIFLQILQISMKMHASDPPKTLKNK